MVTLGEYLQGNSYFSTWSCMYCTCTVLCNVRLQQSYLNDYLVDNNWLSIQDYFSLTILFIWIVHYTVYCIYCRLDLCIESYWILLRIYSPNPSSNCQYLAFLTIIFASDSYSTYKLWPLAHINSFYALIAPTN